MPVNSIAKNNRNEKIEEQIKEIAARIVERESNKTALITITRVELFERGRKAMLLISVLPESGEDSAINFLKRKRKEIREEVKQRMNMRTIPFLDAEIDVGEKARRHIDELLKE